MSTESLQNQEVHTILEPILQLELMALEGFDSFRDITEESINVNHQDKEDFDLLTRLTLAADALHVHPQLWKNKVNQRRDHLKNEIGELGDIINVIEVDQAYCNFLIDLGQYDKAIDLARHITDDYSTPTPKDADEDLLEYFAAQARANEFISKKSMALIEVAAKLIGKGCLDQAADLITEAGPNPEDFVYYYSLLEFLHNQENASAIEALLTDFQIRINSFPSPEHWFITKIYQDLQNQAHESLALLSIHQGELNDAIHHVDLINEPHYRIYLQTKLIGILLEKGDTEQAHKLASATITYINTHTSPLPDFDPQNKPVSFDDTVNSQKLPSPSPDSKPTSSPDYFRHYHRVSFLSSLATILAQHPSCQDLFHLCLDGSRTDGSDSLVHSIGLSDLNNRSSLWKELLKTYLAAGNSTQLETTYHQSCRLCPEDYASLTEEYARLLYDFNPQQALDIIINNPNPERKADGFAHYIYTQITAHGFNGWKTLVTQLVALEDDILGSQSEFSIKDLTSLETDSETNPDHQLTTSISVGSITIGDSHLLEHHFARKSPTLLADLAKLAVTKNEWNIFRQILSDHRLTLNVKAKLICDVTDWLTRNKPLTSWF